MSNDVDFEYLVVNLLSEQESDEDRESREQWQANAIRRTLTPKQQALLDDSAPNVSVRAARRSGKSRGALSKAYIVALESPGALIPIVCLTLKSAKKIYWREMKIMTRHFGLGDDFHESELTQTLSNGSQIFLVGAEKISEIDKLRGGSYDLCVIDEAKSFAPSILDELLEEVISPAMDDKGGQVVMTGTPGNILSGPFYQATSPGEVNENGVPFCRPYEERDDPKWRDRPFEWSFHFWNRKDNTAMPHIWERALEKKKQKGWADDDPRWLREYLGQWCISDDALVYHYLKARDRCTWEPGEQSDGNPFGLPPDRWSYILGVDLGYEDDTAFVIAAYGQHRKALYVCHAHKQSHLHGKEVASLIHEYERMLPEGFVAMVSDVGPMKQLVETLNEQYGLHLEPAEKTFKHDFIELLNGDFRDGRVLVRSTGCEDLVMELETLQYDTSSGFAVKELARRGRLREDPNYANHACDALLYTWRYSLHHFAQEPAEGPAEGTEEWNRIMNREEVWRATRRRASQRFGAEFLPEIEEEEGVEEEPWMN